MNNLKKYLFEEGPLGPEWKLITGGMDEVDQKKNEKCEVKRADDNKFYYRNCPNKEEPKPKTEVSEAKCPPDDSYVEYKDEFSADEINKKKKEEKCKFIQCKDTKKKYYSCPKKESPKNQGTEGGDTEKGGETDKGSEEVKYPRAATPEESKVFDTVPCLKDLPTKVNLNSNGDEIIYKVEVTNDKTIFYYAPDGEGGKEGICVIKQNKTELNQYYHCPETK